MATEYASCYVGINLPDGGISDDFSRLLATVRKIDPQLELTGFNPHVTLYYLGERSKSELDEINETVLPKLPVTRGERVRVGGFGHFENEVFYLKVNSPKLAILHDALVENLGKGENLPFHPHITVCRNREDKITAKTFLQLRQRFNQIHWCFPIEGITTYGSNNPIKDVIRRDLELVDN